MVANRSLTKLISGTPGKKTRFHTRRGELASVRELPRAARALMDRLARRQLREPWLAPPAVRFLETVVARDYVIAELGAGASTRWFAERAARVISLEHDPAWASRVQADLDVARLTNVELHVVPVHEFNATLQRSLGKVEVDLLLVDQTDAGHGGRVESVALGRTLVRPGGFLVLDDSDWPVNSPAFALLHDWSSERFVGIRPRPYQATETTVFRRPTVGAGRAL